MAGQTSAVSWFDGNTHIRVYTCKGQALTEQAWDGSGPWYKGALSVAGTAVGATSWIASGHVSLRVYAASSGKIVEHCWDKDSWYVGGLSVPGESASATSWVDTQNALHIRVYVRTENGAVSEQCWDGGGPWYAGAFHGAT